MADIFLSYAREDLPRARQIAHALESIGWDVWWDRELRPGVDFREEIERQLNEVSCVIVLWSKASVASSFVRDEADHSMKRGVLVQALIEDVRPPFGFGQQNWANLSNWDNDTSSEDFEGLCAGVAHHVPRKVGRRPGPPSPPPPLPTSLVLWLRRRWQWLAGGAATGAAVAAVVLWSPTSGPTVPDDKIKQIEALVSEQKDQEAFDELSGAFKIDSDDARLIGLRQQLLINARERVGRARTAAANATGTPAFTTAAEQEQQANALQASDALKAITMLWGAELSFIKLRTPVPSDAAVAAAQNLVDLRRDNEALKNISESQAKFPAERRFDAMLTVLLQRAREELRLAKSAAEPVRNSASYAQAASKEKEAASAASSGPVAKAIALTREAAGAFDRAAADIPSPKVAIARAQRLLDGGDEAEALKAIDDGRLKYPAEGEFARMLATLATRAKTRLAAARTAAGPADKTQVYSNAVNREQQASLAAGTSRGIVLMWEAAGLYEAAAAAADAALARVQATIRDRSDAEALREVNAGRRAFPSDERFDELLTPLLNRAQSQAQNVRDAVPAAARNSAAYVDAQDKMTQAATRPPADAIPLFWLATAGFKNALTVSVPPPPLPPSREKEIEQLLDRYVAAFRTRDHVAAAQLDPSRSADAWRRYFGNLKISDVALDDRKISIDGDSATAVFIRRIVATTIFGEKLTPRATVTLNLRRSANVWGVASAKESGS